jgi:hypothetical protein
MQRVLPLRHVLGGEEPVQLLDWEARFVDIELSGATRATAGVQSEQVEGV